LDVDDRVLHDGSAGVSGEFGAFLRGEKTARGVTEASVAMAVL
jgi:hypothetical protein